MTIQLAPQKLRVNSIAPGPIETPLWSDVGLTPEQLQSVAKQVNNRLIPEERF
ncbi:MULTISPECIES: SDR family oxidoreductase [unclassified Moorena]|uniref:SDR family oxidoreductase n=1 Tax=unclassified Moorena TaxID=2683338 RepID=UPI0025FFB563|nr:MULTISPECIES: SDR family oxidoreductase [unclassified Moorena]